MSDDLGRRGARGGGITLASQGIRVALQVLGVIVLARLLPPDNFGLIAMVAVFVAGADLIRDFGMPMAALRAPELSRQHASNLFWVSVALGVSAAIVLALAAPLIVALYDEPRLGEIVPVMAIALLLNGVQAQLQVQLARQLRFGAIAVSTLVATTAGLVVAIAAALAGLGYWALVLQPITSSLTMLTVQAASARWIPSRPRRRSGSGALVKSGGYLGLAHLLTFAANNVDAIGIGAVWGAGPLGFYNRAFQVTGSPVTSLLTPLTHVVLPVVNRAVAAGGSAASALLRLQFLVAAPTMIVMVAIATLAPELVSAVLGAEWMPAAPMIQAFAIGECFHALSQVSYWTFLIEDRARALLAYNLVSKSITIGLILCAIPFGPLVAALAYASALAISWPLNVLWLSRTTPISMRPFLVNGSRLLGCAAAALVVGLTLAPLASDRLGGWGAVLTSCASIAVFLAPLLATRHGRSELRSAAQVVHSIFAAAPRA